MQQMFVGEKLVSQFINPNLMVIISLAINKVIKNMRVDQISIRHQLLLDLKVNFIHVRSMVIRNTTKNIN